MMNILNRTKTVVGLFSSDEEISQVINTLAEHGLDVTDTDEVLVIDDTYLPEPGLDNPDMEFAGAPGSDRTESEVQEGTIESFSPLYSGSKGSEENMRDDLIGMGVGEEEATFFARQAVRGNPLVVVQVGHDRAQDIRTILEQANARTAVS